MTSNSKNYPEYNQKYQKKWKKDHPEYSKIWREKHPDKYKEGLKLWHQDRDKKRGKLTGWLQ